MWPFFVTTAQLAQQHTQEGFYWKYPSNPPARKNINTLCELAAAVTLSVLSVCKLCIDSPLHQNLCKFNKVHKEITDAANLDSQLTVQDAVARSFLDPSWSQYRGAGTSHTVKALFMDNSLKRTPHHYEQ